MQQQEQAFRMFLQDSSISVSMRESRLKITHVSSKDGALLQEMYSKGNLPVTNKNQFASAEELFVWLERYRSFPQNWIVKQSVVAVYFAEDTVLEMALKPITDHSEVHSAILKEIWDLKQFEDRNLTLLKGEINQIKESLKEYRSEVSHKLKGIGEVVQNLSNQCQKIDPLERELEKLKETSDILSSQMISSFRSVNNEHELLAKEMKTQQEKLKGELKRIQREVFEIDQRQTKNLSSHKQEFVLTFEESKRRIKQIETYLEKNDIERLKKEVASVNSAFDTEIRIKSYEFKPNSRCLEVNKKMFYLNQRTLKCTEESKDYLKISGTHPFPKGRYSFKIFVKNIKNNGLMFGVCNKKGRDGLEHTSFNDPNLISINSCGYVFNRSLMSTFSGRIKSGDVVKMLVSLPVGEIRWYCNDMELAVVDVGVFKNEQMFPMIGLGNFCDEVDLFEDDNFSSMHESTESYNRQLSHLNEKFSRKSVRY